MTEKILIALNDKVLLSLLDEKIKQEGYKTCIATNGEEALKRMRDDLPDLAIIDTVLSGKNGYEVLQEKSFDRLITKIPVLIISNSGVPIQMRLIPSTPTIRDYLIKMHIEPDDVLEKIAKVFSRVYIPKGNSSSSNVVSRGAGKKVLWVEDDRLLSNILSKKFEMSGYSLVRFDNGKKALEYLANEVPDMIILDILLPEMTGLDILQKIKMNEKLRKIPVLMLSNISKQGDIEKARLLGAQKFMVKAAVSLDEIVNEVSGLIGK